MGEVWAVTEGEYSAYRVVCVCPTKELADSVAEKLAGTGPNDYEVQSFRFFTELPDVVYQLDIDTADVEAGTPHETLFGYLPDEAPTLVCHYWVSVPYGDPRVVGVHVHGMDHERVRKVFTEQWAQAKADAPILIAESLLKYPSIPPEQRAAMIATTSIDAGGRTSP